MGERGRSVEERATASGTEGEEAGSSAAPQGYEEGFRAGVASVEAGVRARELAAAETAQRAAFERGREEGLARGLVEGRDAGRQQGERELLSARENAEARLATLDQLLTAFPAELKLRLEQAEDEMVAVCHAAICRILGEELLSKEGVADHVRQAIREGGFPRLGSTPGQLEIHVHPQDVALLENDPLLAAWLRQHSAAGVVRWVGDERVRLGGCMVRSAQGTLDARLETQLAALQRVMLEGRAARPESTEGEEQRGEERA